jgi:WD40 repeat protein
LATDFSLFTGCGDGLIRQFDLPTGELRATYEVTHMPPGAVNAVWAPQTAVGTSGALYGAYEDSVVRRFSTGSNKVVSACLGHTGAATCLAGQPRKFLYSGSTDNTIREWSMERAAAGEPPAPEPDERDQDYNNGRGLGRDLAFLAQRSTRTFKGHRLDVTAVELAGSRQLFSASYDLTVR